MAPPEPEPALPAIEIDEVLAPAEAEVEARMAEIMGRPAPAEPPPTEEVAEPAPVPPVEAEIPDWMQELAPPEPEPSVPTM